MSVAPRVPPGPEPLFGRDEDLRYVLSFFEDPAVLGGALLVSGDAGVGKSAVLDAVDAAASDRGIRVLRAAGAEFEADVSYSGLNQLLIPLVDAFDGLSPAHRDALRVAIGLGSGPPPDRLLVSTAVLFLLRHVAAGTPLLLIVDDLPWTDRATTAVLGFVARRLAGTRVGFLAASRTHSDSYFERGGLPEYVLPPLDEAASGALLSSRHPALAPAVRQRLITEARGNPLALVELPASLSGTQRSSLAVLPSVLPLNQRLQALFASRVAVLPATCRGLLLVAALDGTGDMAVIEAAAAERAGLEDLAPAERDHLVRVDSTNRRLSFRHPLIGAAVVEASTAGDRRWAHQALAGALTGQPERRAAHLGEAAAGPDEEVAELLEEAARHRLARGDAIGAVAMLTRASWLSPLAVDKSRRLAQAAYVGVDAGGEVAGASQLLAGARSTNPEGSDSLHAAAAAVFLLINGDGDIDTAHGLLVGAIQSAEREQAAQAAETGDAGNAGSTAHAGSSGPDDAMTDALHTLAQVCWFSGRPALWQPALEAVDRLAAGVPELTWLISRTFADPARCDPGTLARLDALIADSRGETDPTRVIRAATAGAFPDRLGDMVEAMRGVIDRGRQGTAPLGRYLGAAMLVCLHYFFAGRWKDAAELSDEGIALCEERGYHFFRWYFQYIQALLAAARGNFDTSTALSDEVSRWAAPRGAHGAVLFACHPRVLTALGGGDFEAAYRHAGRISPPGALAPYISHAIWVALDLVEAATRTGRTDEAAAHVAAMRGSSMPWLSPRLAMHTHAAGALVASGSDAGALFDQALAVPDTERWPFDRARVHLLYGEHLRRLRATSAARSHLSDALEAFTLLGAAPWAARAAAELRAAGHAVTRSTGRGSAELTAQERQIASLAAAGLTNKQIGERLYLSHRTVGTHLYQIFPKLGINSRAQLRDALALLDGARND
ncbi:regulatory protein, luxR family [Actinacidiphila yanglinensis]|uniref:Regulatory protein, luxR family n=1 Tax=Actinacidiphila yanglinensis TaxID=310779 RepID=A0A1H6DSI5_9ACTN|nr:LuxR family transcriptional regulator [Actinacidiphila yanglinensis]SEG87673.1 regulatory protein, luxR family [Actinacidiphila yanglinensis]